ncbi:hypothetical protein B4U79_19113, partial [Dinothrombium tinctorium]
LTPFCPVDKCPLLDSFPLDKPSIYIRSIVDELIIRCDFAKSGCIFLFYVKDLRNHTAICQYNPRNQLKCAKCDQMFPRARQMPLHKFEELLDSCNQAKKEAEEFKALIQKFEAVVIEKMSKLNLSYLIPVKQKMSQMRNDGQKANCSTKTDNDKILFESQASNIQTNDSSQPSNHSIESNTFNQNSESREKHTSHIKSICDQCYNAVCAYRDYLIKELEKIKRNQATIETRFSQKMNSKRKYDEVYWVYN